MTFRQFAFNNVFRNKRLYAAYFLSSLFTVMVFFTFAIFAFHPTLTGGDMRTDVLQGLAVAGGIIYVFSFFFVLYSMSAFLQSRKKEFGVLLMHGMSTRQIRWMVFLENMVIGFFATVLGILLGLVFSKGILLIAENILVINEELNFYFPSMAIVVTFVSFIVLFFFISVFVTFILRTNKLIKLIKGDKIGKSEPKFSIILVILAVLLLGSGYAIALMVKGVYVVAALLPVAALVTLGTYLLFTQLSVFVIRKLKSRENLFWRQTNMLLFSDLSYRMKDNARSFFMVAIISTVAFSAIGTLFGLNSFLTKGIIDAHPTSLSYFVDDEMKESEINEHLNFIEKTLQQYDLDYESAHVELSRFEQVEGEPSFLITTASEYNKIAQLIGEKTIEVKGNEVIPVERSSRTLDIANQQDRLEFITLADGSKVEVDWAKVDLAKPDILPEMFEYFIVSDDLYAKLGEPFFTDEFYDWQVTKGSQDDIIEAGGIISEELEHYVTAVDHIVYTIRSVYAPIMFVGLFIGLIFFISAGSFLYFRLYADLDDDKEKFNAISKIGLTVRELNKVIGQQTAILFFTPIVVAIIHGAVALTALSHMFDYNLVEESLYVLGGFFLIQVIYYIVVRYFYTRQIRLDIK